MTFDQKIQLWNVVGTWFAGLATLAAVIAALYLARKAERVNLRVFVGIQVVLGNGSPRERYISIEVTNLGDRPVTVRTVGWAVGKGKKRKVCVQPVSGPYTAQHPIELAHGKSANFMVSLHLMPNWLSEVASEFIRDTDIRTFVAQVHTSVGSIVEAKPIPDLVESIKRERVKKS